MAEGVVGTGVDMDWVGVDVAVCDAVPEVRVGVWLLVGDRLSDGVAVSDGVADTGSAPVGVAVTE